MKNFRRAILGWSLLVTGVVFGSVALNGGCENSTIDGTRFLLHRDAISQYVDELLGEDFQPRRVWVDVGIVTDSLPSGGYSLHEETVLDLIDGDIAFSRKFLRRFSRLKGGTIDSKSHIELQEELTRLHGGGPDPEDMHLGLSEIVYDEEGTRALMVITTSYSSTVDPDYWGGGGAALVLFSKRDGLWVLEDSVTYIYA